MFDKSSRLLSFFVHPKNHLRYSSKKNVAIWNLKQSNSSRKCWEQIAKIDEPIFYFIGEFGEFLFFPKNVFHIFLLMILLCIRKKSVSYNHLHQALATRNATVDHSKLKTFKRP